MKLLENIQEEVKVEQPNVALAESQFIPQKESNEIKAADQAPRGVTQDKDKTEEKKEEILKSQTLETVKTEEKNNVIPAEIPQENKKNIVEEKTELVPEPRAETEKVNLEEKVESKPLEPPQENKEEKTESNKKFVEQVVDKEEFHQEEQKEKSIESPIPISQPEPQVVLEKKESENKKEDSDKEYSEDNIEEKVETIPQVQEEKPEPEPSPSKEEKSPEEPKIETIEEKKESELQKSVKHTDQEILTMIQECIKEQKQPLLSLISEKVDIGQEEDGNEFELIMIPKLVEVLAPLCSNKLNTDEINELEELFKRLSGNAADFILLKDLLPLFNEKYNEPENKEEEEDQEEQEMDEDLLEGIDKLDEPSINILVQLIEVLQERNVNLFDLFKENISVEKISIDDNEVEIEVIQAQNFFSVLNELGIASEIHENLSTFLSLDAAYPDVFLVKKLIAAMSYFAQRIEEEQEVEEESEAEEEESNIFS